MQRLLSSVILAGLLLAKSAFAVEPRLLHVADLPSASVAKPSVSLARLLVYPVDINAGARPARTQMVFPNELPNLFEVPAGAPVLLPEGWTLVISKGRWGTDAAAELRRGAEYQRVTFESRSGASLLDLLASSTTILHVQQLNSRYLAFTGSGDWQYRFFDMKTGEVVPYALEASKSHLVNLFVDEEGASYIETVPDQTCQKDETGACAQDVGYAHTSAGKLDGGLRRLEFEGKSLQAPLSTRQLAIWDTERAAVAAAEASAGANAQAVQAMQAIQAVVNALGRQCSEQAPGPPGKPPGWRLCAGVSVQPLPK